MGLCVGVFVRLKSSTSSAHYRQVLGGTGLAHGELVVPRCIWVSLMKLPEFLQTAYRKVVIRFFRPALLLRIVEPLDEVENLLVVFLSSFC